LEEKGFQIFARNYFTRMSEIDIVAYHPKEDFFCFVEVKFRKNASSGNPLEAVTFSKQKKIRMAARVYLMEQKINIEKACIRFDVIGILGDTITHVENAF